MTLLAESRDDALRNLNGDYDHIKQKYFNRGAAQMRERAAQYLVDYYPANATALALLLPLEESE